MGTGGPRLGAGRPGWRVKAEACKKIDVREYFCKAALHGQINFWWWKSSPPGHVWRAYGFRANGQSVEWRETLYFPVRTERVVQTIALTRTPCHFGGERYWFECPKCSKRVAVLYLRDELFLCRHCHKISYRSQSFSWTAFERALINFAPMEESFAQEGIKR